MPRRFVGGAQIGRGEHSAAADDGELHSGICRPGARFVPNDVRFVAEHDLVARPGQDFEADLVRHRAARHEKGSLLPEQLGDFFLQPVDRWVFAVLVVANRRRSHSLTHPRRRQGHGVRTKVDTVHGGPDCFTIREFRV